MEKSDLQKKSFASLKFFFAENMVLSLEDKEKLLEETNSILEYFHDLNRLINDKKIAFVAHCMNYLDGPFGSTLGRLYDVSIPWNLSRLKDDLRIFQPPLDNISDFQYIIVLAHQMTSSGSNIEKIFTIAHELQHLSQHIFNKETILKCIVLHRYFYQANDLRYVFSLPHDLDAIRMAKWINYQKNKQQDVDSFTDGRIRIASSNNEEKYWLLLKSIDPFTTYNFCDETESMWKEYEHKIIKACVEDSYVQEAYKFLLSATELVKTAT